MSRVLANTRTRILFVDDDPVILRALARLLKPEAYRWDAMFVTGGPDGLKAVTQNAFDVLVTDLNMPIVDGRALIAAARRSNRVCVLHTGSPVDPRLIDGRILVKPADHRELFALLEECEAEAAARR